MVDELVILFGIILCKVVLMLVMVISKGCLICVN